MSLHWISQEAISTVKVFQKFVGRGLGNMLNTDKELNADALHEYALSKRYEAELDNRQWECLVALIEDYTITTMEQLKEYVG